MKTEEIIEMLKSKKTVSYVVNEKDCGAIIETKNSKISVTNESYIFVIKKAD